MNKAGPTASPTLLVPNFCTLNNTIRQATEIITTWSASKKKELDKFNRMTRSFFIITLHTKRQHEKYNLIASR